MWHYSYGIDSTKYKYVRNTINIGTGADSTKYKYVRGTINTGIGTAEQPFIIYC